MQLAICHGHAPKRAIEDAQATIVLPAGVSLVRGTTPSRKVQEPRAMGQNVIVDLGELRYGGSVRISLTLRLASSVSGTLSFPINVDVPDRNCVDTDIIYVSSSVC